MLQSIQVSTIREIIHLSNLAEEAEILATPDRPISYSFDTFPEPYIETAEQEALRKFLEMLTTSELIELQAVYWLGKDCHSRSNAKHDLENFLAHSNNSPDYMVSYMLGSGMWGQALENALRLLEL